MRSSNLTSLLTTLLLILPFTLAVTKRTALVRIHNNTPHSISGVGLNHKYSDNYRETKIWPSIPAYGYSTGDLVVTYNTGFGTTGRDWWLITGHNDNDRIGANSMTIWYSDPNNFRPIFDWLEGVAPKLIGAALKVAGLVQPQLAPATKVASLVSKVFCEATLNDEKTAGYKQHILRTEDEGKVTIIRVNNDGTIEFLSPSGRSTTVYSTKLQNLGL